MNKLKERQLDNNMKDTIKITRTVLEGESR
jgi:hypothetical protein